MGRRLTHRRTRDSKGENPLSRLCFVGIPKMRLISFWAGRTGSTQRSHTGLNSPLFIYHNLSYHTVKDVLQITSLFFFQFLFCLLKMPYFSTFTPDTYSPGFVFLCSHFSAISISQPVSKVKLPSCWFFSVYFFPRSLCSSFFVFLPFSLS